MRIVQCPETGKPSHWEATALDGSIIATHDFPFTDSDGSPLILEMSIDITEQRRAEEKLISTAKEIEDLYNNAPCGYHSLDANGVFVRINDTELSWLGYTREEIIGKMRASDVCDQESHKVFQETYPIFLERGWLKDLEFNLIRKDGTTLPVLLNATAVKDSSGKFVMSRSTIYDIKDRKLAEKVLLENENRYRQMFQENRAVKLLIDPKSSEIVDANSAASNFYGYELDCLKQMKITDFNVLPIEEVVCNMEQALLREINCFQFRHRLASGEIRDVEVYSTPLELNGRSFLYSIVHDITERQRAERDLIRSNQDLQQFAYVASHDLQEPLRTVASALQMLELEHKGKLGENADRFIFYAVDGAKKMKALVMDLLDYSRLTSRTNKTFAEVDIQNIVDESIGNLKTLIDEKNGKVTCGKMPIITGDSTQMLQVFQNLIGNALKFGSAERPKVHVSAQQNGGEWIFSVRDNGIGIDEKYFDKIFVIFQQLEKKDSAHGTGIGLAIVKKIVERHQGRVWVESKLGIGSTFYFALPTRIVA